ncbi:hypothetical protein B2J88_28360 [Rhodococcus sp. SRB_17]|nr:hypothetical protein [Rhodococcus sp. SRB_17]
MDLSHLRCFVAVAEELHFGRAAARMHLTASPVSRMIKELERELGGELFVRRYHEVQVTPLGRALLERVRDVLRGIDQLDVVAAEFVNGNRVMRIGGTHRAPPAMTDSFIAVVEDGAAPCSVDFVVAQSADLIADVEKGHLAAALVHLPINTDLLDSVIIGSYSFVVAMLADDPLASSEVLALEDLAHRTLTVPPATPHPFAMRRVRQRFVESGIKKFHRMPDYDTVLLASHIRRNKGITISLHPSTGGAAGIFADPGFAVVPLSDELELHVGIVWNRELVDLDPLLQSVVASIKATWTAESVGGDAEVLTTPSFTVR